MDLGRRKGPGDAVAGVNPQLIGQEGQRLDSLVSTLGAHSGFPGRSAYSPWSDENCERRNQENHDAGAWRPIAPVTGDLHAVAGIRSFLQRYWRPLRAGLHPFVLMNAAASRELHRTLPPVLLQPARASAGSRPRYLAPQQGGSRLKLSRTVTGRLQLERQS